MIEIKKLEKNTSNIINTMNYYFDIFKNAKIEGKGWMNKHIQTSIDSNSLTRISCNIIKEIKDIVIKLYSYAIDLSSTVLIWQMK